MHPIFNGGLFIIGRTFVAPMLGLVRQWVKLIICEIFWLVTEQLCCLLNIPIIPSIVGDDDKYVILDVLGGVYTKPKHVATAQKRQLSAGDAPRGELTFLSIVFR